MINLIITQCLQQMIKAYQGPPDEYISLPPQREKYPHDIRCGNVKN